jgi:hypothetical protein
MSDSETSSEVNVKYQNSNSNGEDHIKKPQTTDTDYYFGMIANPAKIISKPKEHESESSELDNLLKDSDTSKSSMAKSSSTKTSKSSSSRTSTKTNSDSKPRYEQMSVSPKTQIPQFKSQMPMFNANQNVNNTNSNMMQHQTQREQEEVQVPKPLTAQEIRVRKIEILTKLCEIKAKGYNLTKDYDVNSPLEEMEYEYELLKNFADRRNGVKLFKNGLLQVVSIIEFFNDKYDPFDFHLSGWGEHMSVEVDSWEDVLEEIYEKYKGTGKGMPPEAKLLYLILTSAFAFHFAKSQAAQLPGLGAVLASNPDLLSKVINPRKETSQFISPQEFNIQKQKEELKKREMEYKEQNKNNQYIQMLQEQLKKQNETIQSQQQMLNQTNTFSAALNSHMFSGEGPQPANVKTTLPATVPASQLRPNIPNIRAPDQVKDILNRIHDIKATNKPSNTETQDDTTSNNDRLISETNVSEARRRGRKPQKAAISIF